MTKHNRTVASSSEAFQRAGFIDVYMTPPKIAKLLRIRPDKVLCWIKSGELAAVDTSEKRGGRPRWKVHHNDLDDFLRRRSAKPPSKPPARRIQPSGEVIAFF